MVTRNCKFVLSNGCFSFCIFHFAFSFFILLFIFIFNAQVHWEIWWDTHHLFINNSSRAGHLTGRLCLFTSSFLISFSFPRKAYNFWFWSASLIFRDLRWPSGQIEANKGEENARMIHISQTFFASDCVRVWRLVLLFLWLFFFRQALMIARQIHVLMK